MAAQEIAWHTPGVYDVAPGVHRIPLALPDDGLRAVNAYLIVDDGGLVLVDPGQALAVAHEQLADGLATLGYRFSDVRGCLATHVHRDHYTQAVLLRREVGCWVGLGADERPSLELVSDPAYGRLQTQLRALPACDAASLVDELGTLNAHDGVPDDIWERPDQWLSPDRAVTLASRTLQVIATPGHTRGHVVLRDAGAGLLFTGDHVLPHITPSIGFEPVPLPLPLAGFLASLRTMTRLPDARMLPAHGPVTPSVHQRVDELLRHHEDRLDRTFEQLVAGRTTVREIAQGLDWTRRQRKLDELDAFNQMLAVLETKAHLDLLADTGRAASEFHGMILRYQPLTPAADPSTS
jgi:glyoxylase-like metal-dependent hydrolase (beta-lactamase superfamily II)